MIGNRLKELRKQNGLTQKELADILKVGQSNVAAYERNATSISIDKLLTLSELYNVSMDYLTCKSDIPHTQAEADFFHKVEEEGIEYLVAKYNKSLPKEKRLSNKEERILTKVISEFIEED